MTNGFSFDRALSYPFKAPHFKSFPWLFALSYAAIFLTLFLVIGLIGWRGVAEWFLAMQQLENDPNPDPGEIFGVIFSVFGQLMPLILVTSLASWAIWAMFEAASQRRYLYGQKFSLGFGGDEVRLMVVGLLWGLLSFVIFLIPGAMMFGAFGIILGSDLNSPMDDATAGRLLLMLGGGSLLMFLFFFVYVFVATRLSPAFALTVKEKEIRFFDAWNVSRGRFWPILGAYVIIVVVASVLSQLVSMVAQLAMMPLLMSLPQDGAIEGEQLAEFFLSPGFIIPMAIIYFAMLFVQGLIQHVAGAPAALAARHDPRNDLGEVQRVDVFS